MKIALAQIDTKIGDYANNLKKIIDNINQAKVLGADLVVFPELSITGYPPRDLLDFKSFVEDNLQQLEEIRKLSHGIGVLCGYIDINKEPYGKKYYNAASLIYNGEVLATHHKCLLPFYDVFDETRYFEPGKETKAVEFMGKRIGILFVKISGMIKVIGKDLYIAVIQ